MRTGGEVPFLVGVAWFDDGKPFVATGVGSMESGFAHFFFLLRRRLWRMGGERVCVWRRDGGTFGTCA